GYGIRGFWEAAHRRGTGFARARWPLPAVRAAGSRPAAGRPRVQTGELNGLLPDRAHDSALRCGHHRPERPPAPL
ncbi:MAG: hypothetical protein AVDCRST_MAG01-01-4649, partial [uncultured Rubrobacteraceae bacterium]